MTTHKNSCPISVSQRGEWAASINPECNCKPLSKCCNKCFNAEYLRLSGVRQCNYPDCSCHNPATPREEKKMCETCEIQIEFGGYCSKHGIGKLTEDILSPAPEKENWE